jgi:drug/metabolite transporter (DMT)-like permease
VDSSALKTLAHNSVLLVFVCTLIGAAAQVFFKLGATALQRATPFQIFTSPVLLIGYALYGLSTGLLILALRRGQLSLLYPVIALTYVWVTILSMVIFSESLNVYKAVGLAVVIAGVAVIGRDGRS